MEPMIAMSRVRLVAVALALVSISPAASALAGQRRPVPEVALLGRDGRAASVKAAIGDRTVVVVYLMPATAPSERLLEAMKTWSPPVDPGRVVLVVDGQSADAGQWLAAHLAPGGDAGPAVFFDVDGSGRKALGVTGAPTLMGVEKGEIRWDLAGVLNEPAALEPVLRNWTTRR